MNFDFSNLNLDSENLQNLQNLDVSNFVDMEQMNKLINKASDQLLCDKDCKKERNIATLKKKYDELQKKDEDYDEKLARAKKAYYVAAFGDAAFRKEVMKEIEQVADESSKKLKKEIDMKLLQLETAFNTMEQAKLNMELTKELVEKLKEENEKMEQIVKNDENKTAINQRLAVYEYNHLTTVDFFNSIVSKLLIVFFIVYLGMFIYYKLGYSRFNIGFLIVLSIIVFYNYLVALFKSLFNAIN